MASSPSAFFEDERADAQQMGDVEGALPVPPLLPVELEAVIEGTDEAIGQGRHRVSDDGCVEGA
jgi:hypothetical protein